MITRNTLILILFVLSASSSICLAEALIVAHRGASKDAPENTIPAFELAWEQGADAIEGDFHLSKDGEIVCIHDKDTRKVSGEHRVVRRTTLGELRQLEVGRYHSDAYAGTSIPTIAEVFATIPAGKKFYIEVKSGPAIVPKLIEEIEKCGLDKSQITVISFNENVIRALKTKAPQYKAYWLSGFKKAPSGETRPTAKTIVSTLKKIGADGFSSSKTGISEEVIKEVKANGYEYHVWTVDDVETARKFVGWGAQSITTNVPGLMREQLME